MKKIKNKIRQAIPLLAIGGLVLGCTNLKKENETADNIIYFDSSRSIEKFDMKDLTDSTFQIIPLETTDDCLIVNIDKIEIKNKHIYIMDNFVQSVYIFDMDGKYSGKINAVGQGPGEYAHLSYMTVTDSSVIVIDHFMGKQIEYRLTSLQFIKEEQLFKKIWATEIFSLSGHIYYINSWSDSPSGKFRLFSRKDNNTDSFDKFLPFDKDIAPSMGINGPVYAINRDEVSLIYQGRDLIYRIRNGDVFPEYEVKFKDKKVVYSSKVENVFKENPPGRVIGINVINESDKFLFIDVSMTGDPDYTFMYNKSDHTTIVYPQIAINSLFDNEQIQVNRIIDNKIIHWRDARTLLLQKEYLYAEQTFKNKPYETCLKNVLANLTEESNPVLFIFNLKE